jgi:hypothetical protein
VLEDRPDEVEARVDRARAVGLLLFSVGLALHESDEVFEVRDRHTVEADIAEEGHDVVVEECLLVRAGKGGKKGGMKREARRS